MCFTITSEGHRIVTTLLSWLPNRNGMMTSGVELIVSAPSPILVDDTVAITVNGLRQSQHVTLAHFVECEGKRFAAWAHYAALSTDGSVSTTRHASLGGCYTGLRPMGLWTHMRPCAGERDGQRLMLKDLTRSMRSLLSVHNGWLDGESDVAASRPLATGELVRTYMGEGVRRERVSAGRLRGWLYLPEGAPPFRMPVIDMFGTAGGCAQYRSALLASRGFVSLALAFLNYEDLPRHMQFDLDYFEEAAEWLLRHPLVRSSTGGVGVVGVSKGAEIAAEMAAHFGERVRCAVLINGSYMYWETSRRGSSVPTEFAPNFTFLPARSEHDPPELTIVGPASYDLHARDDPVGVVPVEAAHPRTRFLYVVGEDDANYPSALATRQSLARLERAGRGRDAEVASYPGAGHLVEPPYSPLCSRFYNVSFGVVMDFGGRPDEHAHAQEDSWRRILAFLRKNLAPEECRNASKL